MRSETCSFERNDRSTSELLVAKQPVRVIQHAMGIQNKSFLLLTSSQSGDTMLTIKCAACKTKLWRYDKIGPGEVLRCHKSRIDKVYTQYKTVKDKIYCTCGKPIGIDKGSFYKMISKAFTYSGTKRNN